MVDIRHKDTAEVLLSVPGNSLRGATLNNARLAGADLSGMDLCNAAMRGVDLQEAVLDKAELIGACLDGANLTQASLIGANLTDASLQKARLRKAHLNGCCLRYARLAGADLTKACLVGADLSLADLRAELPSAELRTANMRGANLTDANLIRANLIDADLTGAVMVHTTIAEARLKGAKLQGVVTKEAEKTQETPGVGKALRAITVDDGDGGVTIKIRVECAHCGQPQQVPRAKLEHFTTCNRCEQQFYIDHAGQTHTTRPVTAMDWTPEVSKEPNIEHEDWEWQDRWTRPAVVGGIVLLSLPVVWMIFSFVSSLFEPPKELAGRAIYVGEAFAAGNERRVLAVTQTGAEEAAKLWLHNNRSTDWDNYIKSGGEIQVQSTVLFANHDTKVAKVDITISGVPLAGSEASKPLSSQIASMWQLNEQDQWMLAPKYMLPEP